ncbi:MAG TPA: macrolide ABC transporter ATP-binding protein [Firmicutes bacterium]|nr:macrolide ABC transporter ATP-binding protein [Bacillota bacterium]
MLGLHNITKSYFLGEMAVPVLLGINLTVKEGEFVSIMGPSGSGKSTLMNILGCLDRPTGGSYQIDGIEVARMDDDQLAQIRNRKIGFVFQNFNLLPRINARDNVALPMIYSGIPRAERERIAGGALRMVGLADRGQHRPNELSGGQRQRVAIARALVNNPAIILADEPTGNLDSRAGEEIMAIFQQLVAEGRTVVLVTHEPDIAAHTRRIIYLKDGRILEDKAVTEPRTAAAEVAVYGRQERG